MTEQHRDFDAFDRQCEDLRNKWLRRRAKPEVWAAVERLCKNEMDMLNCTLELRARVEALEAAAKPAESNDPAEPNSSLVGLVAEILDEHGTNELELKARIIIRQVAAWLRLKTDFVHGPQCALWLEREADRHPS